MAQGDTVGVMLADSDGFKLIINGVEEEQLHWGHQNGQSVYAIFDLYGQCRQVSFLTEIPKLELLFPINFMYTKIIHGNVDKNIEAKLNDLLFII